MIPELESLKLYIQLLEANLDDRDAESHIWYNRFITIIDEHHAMLTEFKNENNEQI